MALSLSRGGAGVRSAGRTLRTTRRIMPQPLRFKPGDRLKEAADNAARKLDNAADDAVRQLDGARKDVIGGVKGGIDDAGSKISDAVGKVAGKVERATDSASAQIDAAAREVEHAAAQVPQLASGALSNPASQAAVLAVVATYTAVAGAVALAFPAQVAQFAFQVPTDAVIHTMVRMAGALLISSAATKYTLREAALRSQLHLDTFKRLSAGLMVSGAAWLAVIAQGASVRTPELMAAAGFPAVMSLLVGGRLYGLHKGGLPIPDPTAVVKSALNTLVPKGLTSLGYSLLTAGCAAMAAMLLATSVGQSMPAFDGSAGAVAVWLRRGMGAASLVAMLMAFSLKDAADRGKLGNTTFRWLNLGLALSFAGMCGALVTGGMAHTQMATAMLAAKAAACLFTGGNFLRYA